MTSKTGSRAGFTLIEVLIAVSIMAVGTVSVLRAYSTSVGAMERAQYNVDAACLLKAVMGEIEEKAVMDQGTAPGESSGEADDSTSIKMDTTKSGRWQWTAEIRASGLQAAAPKEASASGEETEGASQAKAQEEAGEGYSLNEVKLTAVNYERAPSNKVSIATYMEAVGEE